MTYPDATVLAYSPNALGEATRAGAYASGVSYHPNGAVDGYTLGNGIVHTLTQNTRGLPRLNRDTGVVQDLYGYDANGNVTAINDQQEGVSSRSMAYDGLDRLITANGPGVWGAASYGYDPLGNMRTSAVGSRSSTDNYGTNNRLATIDTNGVFTGYAHDARGNVTGRGSQGFYFDLGNRMALANGVANYAYDGWGRRVSVSGTNGVARTQVYSNAGGQLLYSQTRQGMNTWLTRYIYLGDKLIAETDSGAGTSYAHTDALGSPVGRTSSSGQLLSRTRYEPYGKTAAGVNPGSNGFTGVGFTGHVNDADTGLVYMQQRYYDPMAARFLSVDPVTTDANAGQRFSRYEYGNNNPYRYKDPDGRLANFVFGAIIGGGIEVGFQLANGGIGDWTAVGVAAGVGAVTGGVGGVMAKMATTGAASTAQAVAATAAAGGLAAATGKNVEAASKGESATSSEVAVSAAAAAVGSAIGGKLATKSIAAAEKAAASSDNVVSGVGKNTLDAIRHGGASGSVTTGASEATQRAADMATGAGGKLLETKVKQ